MGNYMTVEQKLNLKYHYAVMTGNIPTMRDHIKEGATDHESACILAKRFDRKGAFKLASDEFLKHPGATLATLFITETTNINYMIDRHAAESNRKKTDTPAYRFKKLSDGGVSVAWEYRHLSDFIQGIATLDKHETVRDYKNLEPLSGNLELCRAAYAGDMSRMRAAVNVGLEVIFEAKNLVLFLAAGRGNLDCMRFASETLGAYSNSSAYLIAEENRQREAMLLAIQLEEIHLAREFFRRAENGEFDGHKYVCSEHPHLSNKTANAIIDKYGSPGSLKNLSFQLTQKGDN
jgi:hypothetical protein